MMTNEEIRKLLDRITPGRWAVTTYGGGLSFNGPKRVYCGTDEYHGEPRTIPASDADVEFIAAAPFIVRDLLAKLEEAQRYQVWQLPPEAKPIEGKLSASIAEVQAPVQVRMVEVPVQETFWRRAWRILRLRPRPMRRYPVIDMPSVAENGQRIVVTYPTWNDQEAPK